MNYRGFELLFVGYPLSNTSQDGSVPDSDLPPGPWRTHATQR